MTLIKVIFGLHMIGREVLVISRSIHYLPRSLGKWLPQQSPTELNNLPISLEPRRASCMARRRHPLQLQTGQKFQKTMTFSTAGPSTPIDVTKGAVEYNSR